MAAKKGKTFCLLASVIVLSMGVGSIRSPSPERTSSNPLVGDFRFAGNRRVYKKYAVTAEVPICSQMALNVLMRGGNAVDASITSLLCEGIVNSFSSGIGGGGYLLLKGPKGSQAYNFRESAPRKSGEGIYNSKEDSAAGSLSIGVPGEVSGMRKAHTDRGKLPWKSLFEEPIFIAEEGFEVTKELAKRIKKFEKEILSDEGLRGTYSVGGRILVEGETVKRKNLAQTLRRIAEDPDDFYRGELARRSVAFIKARGGVIEEEDLLLYTTEEMDTLHAQVGEYSVLTTGLPTSGVMVIKGLLLLSKLGLLERRVLFKNTAQFHHYLAEIFKFLFSERALLGDPVFLTNPKHLVKTLLSSEKVDRIAKAIQADRVLGDMEYGSMYIGVEDHGTTHVNVVDGDELMVSATSTINTDFGSKIMDPETGIIFNNEIDDFSFRNFANSYGVGFSLGNMLQPGKRPFSSACPTIITGKEKTLVIGAAGGTRIPTSVLSVISYVMQGVDLYSAIAAPRLHHQLSPNVLLVEASFSPQLAEQLSWYGHQIRSSGVGGVFSSTQAIVIDKANRLIYAVSDERKGGDASGE
jgi:gamma-glutamyltranspeptidase / glutathione hydrolase / leukotriene-C4 hydrolase